MALNRHVLYGDRWDATDTSSSTQVAPQGAFRDKDDGQLNGSYLNSAWANDCFSGLNGAFLANVHQADGTPAGYSDPFNASGYVDLNGAEDTAQSSQVYNAWYKKTVDTITKQNEELQVIADGCFFNYYSTGSNPVPAYTSGDAAFYAFESDRHVGSNILIDSDTKKIKVAKKGLYLFSFVRYAGGAAPLTPSGNVYIFEDAADTSATTRPADETKDIRDNMGLIVSQFASQVAQARSYFNVVSRDAAISNSEFLQINSTVFAPDMYLNIENDDTTLSMWSETDVTYGFTLSLQRMGAYQPSLTLPVIEGND